MHASVSIDVGRTTPLVVGMLGLLPLATGMLGLLHVELLVHQGALGIVESLQLAMERGLAAGDAVARALAPGHHGGILLERLRGRAVGVGRLPRPRGARRRPGPV